MRDWIVGQGVVVYVFAGCLFAGLVSAFIANHGYKKYIRESEIMGSTQNRLLKYIKLKFGSYYKLNMRPQDSRALTRHYLYKCRVGFFNVMTWIKISKFAAGVMAAAALVDLIWMLDQGRSPEDMMAMICCCLVGLGLLYMQHRIYDFPEKRNMLEWYLMDYLENFLKNKIESAPGNTAAARDGAGSRPPEKQPVFGEGQEPAAAAARAPKTGPDPVIRQESREEDDDLDARIVSDILKEFL